MEPMVSFLKAHWPAIGMAVGFVTFGMSINDSAKALNNHIRSQDVVVEQLRQLNANSRFQKCVKLAELEHTNWTTCLHEDDANQGTGKTRNP